MNIPYYLSHQFWIHDHPGYFVLLCIVACLLGVATGQVIKSGKGE